MKKFNFLTFAILVGTLNPGSASGELPKVSRGSLFVAAQVGIDSYAADADRQTEPFDAMPVPLGASFEYYLADHLGIGGAVMFDQWHDYLGMYAGKWTFRLFKPSLDITYHFPTDPETGLAFFGGASLGYSLLSVGNELGNDYGGNLKSEPCLAPFIGAQLRFGKNLSGFWDRLRVSLKFSWSLTGHFSGLYGVVGVTYRIK